jgi:peptidoglycan hydrolase-like protein with peptidoglycan-binding domain
MRNKLLQIAHAELGVTENPPGTNKSKYGKWYGSGLDGQKWCAMFVSWVFDQTGIPLGNIQTKNGIHHCQSAHNYYKSKGMLTTDPQPGDIVLYDWTGDGYADHIGIFKKWTTTSKTALEAYEGNTSQGNNSDGGKVMLRTRSRNLVKSFVNPGVFTDIVVVAPSEVLEVGSRGSDVTVVQNYLFELGCAIVVDGWFGKQTEGFIKDFQQRNGMTVTGKADPMTIGSLQESAAERKIAKAKFVSGSYLIKGNSGILVVELQTALNKEDTNLGLPETGVFGNLTCNAVKAFQKKHGLSSDGVVGPITWGKLGLK